MKIDRKECLFNLSTDIDEQNDPLGTISGYGSVFGNVDSCGDIVDRGAFVKSLNEYEKEGKKIPFLYQHDVTKPIGYLSNTFEDEKGLNMKSHLLINDVKKAKEAYALAKAKVLTGLSIGYIPINWYYDSENNRHLTEVKLMEVSLVTFPANEKANILTVKSNENLTIRDAEKALTNAGFSNKQAKIILSKGYKAIERDVTTDQRDVDLKACESIKQLVKLFE